MRHYSLKNREHIESSISIYERLLPFFFVTLLLNSQLQCRMDGITSRIQLHTFSKQVTRCYQKAFQELTDAKKVGLSRKMLDERARLLTCIAPLCSVASTPCKPQDRRY